MNPIPFTGYDNFDFFWTLVLVGCAIIAVVAVTAWVCGRIFERKQNKIDVIYTTGKRFYRKDHRWDDGKR